MADFRMKLFVLAGMATAFAGMASAQLVCSQATTNAVFVRSESNDDQVGDTTVTCSVPTGNTALPAGGGTVTMTVYLSPSVNITSATLGSGSSAKSETLAGLTSAASPGTTFTSGVVSGNSVTFSGIVIPGPIAAGAPAFTLTITNIKIAASTVATGSGVPTGVSETIFVSGTNTTPSAITTASAVAYVTSGITGIKASGNAGSNNNQPYSIPLCNSVNAYSSGLNGAEFTVAFAEAFPNSFKIQGAATAGQAASGSATTPPFINTANTTLGSWYTNHTETGLGFSANGTTNQATSGTRIKIIFNNIPANVTFYVSTVLNATTAGGGTATLTASETGAYSAVAGTTANGTPGAASSSTAGTGIAAPLTVTSGSATAIYEVTTVSTSPATFVTSVYLAASAGAVPAPTSAITATVSMAPIGATSNVPNFINGASTTTVNGSTFSACATTLMFPFVTNVAGFETGLAISNTGADLLKTATSSSVTGQTGTCVLTFFSSATASSNPPAYTSPAVVPGTTWASTLTSVTGGTPGTISDGYAIAQCNFLYAHGYAFIVYNVGQASAMAEGYLALVVTPGRASSTAVPEAYNN
jgi:hypothetical protein